MDLMSLRVRVDADTSGAEQSIQNVGEDMEEAGKAGSSFGDKLAAAFTKAKEAAAALTNGVKTVVGKITDFTTNAAHTTDRIDKMSQKIGISREAFQEMDFIMSQSGGSVESLQMGMKTLRNAMTSASDETSDAAAMFKKLGVSIYDSKGKMRSQEEVMFDTIEVLQMVGDETERAQLATQLFGRAGMDMIPLLNSGAGSIENMRNQAHDLGLVLGDEAVDAGVHLTDTIDQTQRAFDAITTQLGVDLMPVVQNVLSYVVDHMPQIREVVNNVLNKVRDVVAYVVNTVYPQVKAVLEEKIIPAVRTAINAIVAFWNDTLKPKLEELWKWTSEILVPALQNAWSLIKSAVRTAFSRIIMYWDKNLKPIWEALKTWVVDTLVPALSAAWDGLKAALGTVFEAIAGFWTNTLLPAWNSLIIYIRDVLIPGFSRYWETYIQPIIQNVFNFWVSMWNDTLKPAFDGIVTFFSGIFSGDLESAWDGITEVFKSAWIGIKNYVVYFMKQIKLVVEGVLTAVLGFFGVDFETLKTEYLQPIVDFVTGTFTTAWNGVKTGFETLWNDVLVPIGEFLSTTFLTAWTAIKEYWETGLEPRLTRLRTAFLIFRANVLTPIATFLKDTFLKAWEALSLFFKGSATDSTKNLGSTFKRVWNSYLKPVADWLSGTFTAVWEGIQTVMNGLIDFLTGVFSGDWRLAWNGLVEIASGIFSTMANVLRTPVNAVIDLINGMISSIRDAINTVIGGINNTLHIVVPAISVSWQGVIWDYDNPWWDWKPQLGTLTWPDQVIPRIPELAKGGTVLPGGSAIVGEAGAELLQNIGGHAVVTPFSKGGGMGATFNATFNITASQGQNVEELAREIEKVMTRWTTQKAVAYV